MTSTEPPSFDDPALKRMCCRAWAGESASSSLRDRLKQSCQAARLGDAPLRLPVWSRPSFGLATAAAVLLVFGVGWFAGSESPGNEYAMNDQLTAFMINTHAQCATRPNHHMPGLPSDDMLVIGRTLKQKLHTPVLAASLPEDGWRFRGGAICPVGDVPAAHLVFSRGSASVSVFSMPKSACAQTKAGSYETMVHNHPVAGFVNDQGAFCLVASGDGTITPRRLAGMRDRMQQNIAARKPLTREQLAGGELLYPQP